MLFIGSFSIFFRFVSSRFSLSILMGVLLDFPPQTRPKIIKQTAFCNFWKRSFSRSYFGRYFGCILHAKTFKNHTKNNGFEAFSIFWKSHKKYSKIEQKYHRKSPKSMKITLPKSLCFSVMIFWIFSWFLLDLGLHFETILVFWSLQNRFVGGHGSKMVSKRPFGVIWGRSGVDLGSIWKRFWKVWGDFSKILGKIFGSTAVHPKAWMSLRISWKFNAFWG